MEMIKLVAVVVEEETTLMVVVVVELVLSSLEFQHKYLKNRNVFYKGRI